MIGKQNRDNNNKQHFSKQSYDVREMKCSYMIYVSIHDDNIPGNCTLDDMGAEIHEVNRELKLEVI